MREKKRPAINRKVCAGCSVCVENCPMDCLEITGPKYHGDIHTTARLVKKELCVGCGKCAEVCPIQAIIMKGV